MTPSNQNGTSAVSDVAVTPEPEFSLQEEITDRDEKSSFEKIRADSEFYKRVGFYCAFNKLPSEEYQTALIKIKREIGLKITELTTEFDNDLKRLQTRKTEAENKAVQANEFIERYISEIAELEEKELPSLKKRFEDLRAKVKAAVINIGAKKETLIRDRQKSLLEEFNRLHDELDSVVRKRMGLNEEIYLKQKDVLEKKKEFWENLFKRYDMEHEEVLAKLKLYGISGFHFISSGFLYNAGLVSATVAGAFFAFFAETNYFTSGGVLSFIIQSLFTFSTGFIGQGLDTNDLGPYSVKIIYAGILLLVFLFLLALMLGVTAISQVLYQKLFQKNLQESKTSDKSKSTSAENTEVYAIEINLENKDLPIKTKISEKSFLAFWIHITPSLLFLLIVFLLVSLGTDVNNIKSLDASLAGYGIGFLTALGAGGILYIYLTMFLERRIEEQISHAETSGKSRVSWLRLNTELILLISTFIAVILIILLLFQHPFRQVFSTQSMASLMLFTVSCFLSAFTIGYGIRLRSLETSRQNLEISCDIIQTKLIRISRPLQIYLTPKENANFNFRFIAIRNEIMSLMLSRTVLTRKAIETPLVKDVSEKNKFFHGVNKLLKKVLSWQKRNPNPREEQGNNKDGEHWINDFTASEEIKLCFPQLEAELKALESEKNEIRGRIDFIDDEIKTRKEQGQLYEEKLREIKYQERRSRIYHKAIINREKIFHRKSNLERQKESYFTQKISEGYELGDWFKKHNPSNTIIPNSGDI